MSDVEDKPPPVLLPCSICSRTFRPEVLDRHTKVCAKTATKKRRVFDSFKSRVSGTELEEFLGPAPLPGQAPKKPPEKSPVKKPQKPKWKETHESLIAVLRAARGAANADPTAALPKNPANEQCPSCGRFFGPRAFDRHVQFCKEKTSRIKMTPSKVSQAQERLEARTKYKAPLSLKPKLTTKEKYSPMLPRKVESSDNCSNAPIPKSPVVHLTSNKMAKAAPAKPVANSFTRQSPTRSSERQRSISPKKTMASTNPKATTRDSYATRSPAQPKIKDNLKDTETDLRPRTGRKMPGHQDKLRNSSRKMSDFEGGDVLGSNQKYPWHEKKKNRKLYVSSDDGNETDTNVSIHSIATSNSEKLSRKNAKRGPGRESPDSRKRSSKAKESPSPSKDGSRSSRRSTKRLPMINDLSVNDESFGIHVEPCPHRSSPKSTMTTTTSGYTKPRKKVESPRKKDVEDRGRAAESPKVKLDVVIPTVLQNRSSRIPKPVLKAVEVNKEEEEEEDAVEDTVEDGGEDAVGCVVEPPRVKEEEEEEEEDDAKKDRRRTAVIRRDGMRKWHDISNVSTSDLLHMAEDFDFMSELDGLQLGNELETEGSETEEFSRSTMWELTGEEGLRSDDSTDYKALEALIPEPNVGENKEDEFIVLHVAEPEKLTDDDMHMKLSLSEPCFKTDYPEVNSLLKVTKENANVFLFNSTPKYTKKRMSPPAKKSNPRKAKEVQMAMRMSATRERTFLANDNPASKRRRLSGKEEIVPPKFGFGLSDHPFSLPPRVQPEGQGSGVESKAEENPSPSSGSRLERRRRRRRLRRREANEPSPEKTPRENSAKKFEYFEIGKNVHDDDDEPLPTLARSRDGNKTRKDREGEEMSPKKSKKKDQDKENVIDEAMMKGKNPPRSPSPVPQGKKCAIVYSDEEFEELRKKKEECLTQLQPKDNEPSADEDEAADASQATMDVEEPDSPPTVKSGSLDNIAEEEDEQQAVTDRKIDIEDFIIKKPNKMSIMSKNGNCLEKLFPKPPEMVELKTTESTTAVPLGYVVDSLYDLRDEESVARGGGGGGGAVGGGGGGRMLRKGTNRGVRLPEIEMMAKARVDDEKASSMSSLVRIWKNRKQMIENGTLYKSTRTESDRNRQNNQKTQFQIALLPIVLTQKLAEVAGQLDKTISKDDGYDPFEQAERQMLALLSWPSTADLKSPHDNDQSPKNPLQRNHGSNLEASPTSAFTKYAGGNDERARKSAKDDANQRKAEGSMGRSGDKYKGPVCDGADDWEQIFEKHFDLNRNEVNDKMTRSVKSALDGLLKGTARNANYSTSSEAENSPPRRNESDVISPPKVSSSRLSNAADTTFDMSGRKTPSAHGRNKSDLSESSIVGEIAYTSTPKRSSSRLSNSAADSTFEKAPGKMSSSTCGRITPPDDFDDRGRRSNRNSGVSLSSLSFCSQASDTTLADEEIMRTNLEIIGKATPRGSKRRFARSQSVFDERNKMLFAKTFEHNFSSSDENEALPAIRDDEDKKATSNNPYPKSVPSRFPRSQSVMDGRCRGDGDHFQDREQVSSPEGSKSRKSKMSGDSAYSSLNRRSPRSSNRTSQQEDRLSSSGSEHSLPPLNNDHALKPRSLNYEATQSVSTTTTTTPPKKDQPYKMSKFCHECGSKYPIAVAKFCCECGVRRLII